MACRNSFQTKSTTSIFFTENSLNVLEEVSQSLPNQVNYFNTHYDVTDDFTVDHGSQSLQNQVNDFNLKSGYPKPNPSTCRNPFQTRSTTSIYQRAELYHSQEISQSLPNQVNDFNSPCSLTKRCLPAKSQSLPNQVNDFNNVRPVYTRDNRELSQSLPNQVNDFNFVGSSAPTSVEAMSQSLPNQVNDFNPPS